MLAGQLSLQQIMFSIELEANIHNRSLSDVRFSGGLETPFNIMLSGSYSLSLKSPSVSIIGRINVENLLDLSLMAQASLETQMLSDFILMGMLTIQPLHIHLTAHYDDALPSSDLSLSGSVSIQGGTHAIMIKTTLNTSSDPVSVQQIAISGVFPPPLDFIEFTGMYSQHCSCALLEGNLTRDSFDLLLSTNLTFQSSTEIASLHVQVNFHRPLNLILLGEYSYSNNTGMTLIDVHGMFSIPQVINFGTELELVLQGMDPMVLGLHFNGTFPSPLSLQVMGTYNKSTNDVILMGNLNYDFIQLEATSRYQFMDDVHNTSAMLGNLHIDTSLLARSGRHLHVLNRNVQLVWFPSC